MQELPANGVLFTYNLRLILLCQRFRLRLGAAVVENDRVNLRLSTKCQADHLHHTSSKLQSLQYKIMIRLS